MASCSRTSSVLIKTSFLKEERICKVRDQESSEIDFSAAFQQLYCFISRMYCLDPDSFIVQYVDEEYDLITMMDHRDLVDAFESARKRRNQMPKVFVRLKQDCDTSPLCDRFACMRKYNNLQWCNFLEELRSHTSHHVPLFSFLNNVISNLQDGVPIDEALKSNLEECLSACRTELFEHVFWQLQQHENHQYAAALAAAAGLSFEGPCKIGAALRHHHRRRSSSSNSSRRSSEGDEKKKNCDKNGRGDHDHVG